MKYSAFSFDAYKTVDGDFVSAPREFCAALLSLLDAPQNPRKVAALLLRTGWDVGHIRTWAGVGAMLGRSETIVKDDVGRLERIARTLVRRGLGNVPADFPDDDDEQRLWFKRRLIFAMTVVEAQDKQAMIDQADHNGVYCWDAIGAWVRDEITAQVRALIEMGEEVGIMAIEDQIVWFAWADFARVLRLKIDQDQEVDDAAPSD